MPIPSHLVRTIDRSFLEAWAAERGVGRIPNARLCIVRANGSVGMMGGVNLHVEIDSAAWTGRRVPDVDDPAVVAEVMRAIARSA